MMAIFSIISCKKKLIHVLRLCSLEYGISAIISEYEADQRSTDELLCSIVIVKFVRHAFSSKLAVAKQFVCACSLVLDLHRLIILFSMTSCQLSAFRKCENVLSLSN